ncbi:MAG: hypothetical protein J0H53_00300 [Rhizobiales bacterium]|nr:hypothetical protein [Hyphomicrobiales bacterium]OJU37492.1 MAG: hypothetical protein BGN94_08835 [Rhizobiales bacterium 68-8]
MNMLHDGERPALPAGHPALAGGDTLRTGKKDGAVSRAPDQPQPALRRPPRVRKVDSGEVYRFWAFR